MSSKDSGHLSHFLNLLVNERNFAANTAKTDSMALLPLVRNLIMPLEQEIVLLEQVCSRGLQGKRKEHCVMMASGFLGIFLLEGLSLSFEVAGFLNSR